MNETKLHPDAQNIDGEAFKPISDGCIPRNRLWMWGHDSGDYDGPNNIYNIPESPPVGMVDAIRSMGIPNVCSIRPGRPEAGYLRQFEGAERVEWALYMGDRKGYGYREFRQDVMWLREAMPNLTGYYLDDFFLFNASNAVRMDSGGAAAPAGLSLAELADLRGELSAGARPIDLAAVLYTYQLCPAIRPAMEHMDKLSLWIWDGNDIASIEENFTRYRELVPDKPTLLGIYMWDFGGGKELGIDFMAHQLDYALRLYGAGQIEGLIFHCTPLCNKGLAAVDYARDWIARHTCQY